jgi:hypothetical protein
MIILGLEEWFQSVPAFSMTTSVTFGNQSLMPGACIMFPGRRTGAMADGPGDFFCNDLSREGIVARPG